jgi:tRNA pseudouridine38-40 synthase
MRNIKLIIEYDGTNYRGWQVQPNVITIQGEIEKVIKKICGENIELNGSGRTDAGVHARGQVANFLTNSRIPPEKFAFALNAMLPRDIVIRTSEEVDRDFHARYSAKGKEYSYTIINSMFPSAIMRNFAYNIDYCERLDIDKFKKAAEYFIGTHDFAGFMSMGSSIKSTVRTIYSIDTVVDKETIRIFYKGNGFLYNMVRIITGTLIFAGVGKIAVDDISDIIKSKDRTRAGITAPPYGLYLDKVIY